METLELVGEMKFSSYKKPQTCFCIEKVPFSKTETFGNIWNWKKINLRGYFCRFLIQEEKYRFKLEHFATCKKTL